MNMLWSINKVIFLKEFYSNFGQKYCANKLHVSLNSIRNKVARLELKLNKNSNFYKNFQKRAGENRRNKKNGFFGKHHSIETINNIRKKNIEYFINNPSERKRRGIKTKEWLKNNDHPKGMLHKHHTQKSKDKIISTKLKKYNTLNFRTKKTNSKMLKTRMERYGTLNFFTYNTYSRSKRGWKTIGQQKYFFRSSWEKNYACYLEWLKNKGEIKNWRFETKTFWFNNIKRGVRSYLPDFEITDKKGNIEYHEVKGWMDKRSQTKINRMAKYYPEVKLIIIDSTQYKEIKKWSKLIEGWE